MFSAHRAWGCLFGFLLTVFASHALAPDDTPGQAKIAGTVQGSSTTARSVTDGYAGQLNIYVGSLLPVGTTLVSLRFLFDHSTYGNTSGYITPLLFESKTVEAATVYTVVGIGKTYGATISPTPQSIPFQIVEGTKVAVNGNFTFGFITAIVDSNGNPVTNSKGVMDYDTPTDGGAGVGGPLTTNDWEWTIGGPALVVSLGTTFGLANADLPLGQPYRTYSAQAIGLVAAQ